jgi:hypothetical protein
MKNSIQWLVIGLTLMSSSALMRADEAERYTKVANRLVEFMNSANYSRIEGLYNKEMADALPLDKTTTFFKGIHAQFGKLDKLDPPRPAPAAMLFVAHFERGMLDLQLSLDSSDKIAGVYLKVHTDSKPAPEKHQTRLSLPFSGRWLVFWGGDTVELNKHHEVPNQRFAFDLLGVGPDGKTRRGKSDGNEDYYAFGREVLAPADGTVIEVIEGVHDNKPGSMNPFSGVGNCVMIQHRPDEVSLIAHFKQGTIKVKQGDHVMRGQVLGLCGNSGNSSEPHIHYHLQHSPVIQDGLGIKCIFDKVSLTRDGKTEARENYSPIKGDIITP